MKIVCNIFSFPVTPLSKKQCVVFYRIYFTKFATITVCHKVTAIKVEREYREESIYSYFKIYCLYFFIDFSND